MKWNRLAILNGMIAVALWVSFARAAQTFYFFEPLNFKLTVLQQQFEPSTNRQRILAIHSTKLTNNGLLSLLASAFETNWPTGANLAVDRSSGDLFVVDATCTNPVCNVSYGLNVDDTNVVFFRCQYDRTIAKYHGLDRARPGGVSEHTFDGTRYGMVFFHLFIEQDGVTNTDLSFAGLDVVDNHSHIIEFTNPAPTIANTSSEMKETIPVTGDGVFDENWSVVEGTVTSHQEIKDTLLVGSPILRPPEPPLPPPIILQPLPPPLNVITNVFTNIVIPPVIVFTNIPPLLLTNRP